GGSIERRARLTLEVVEAIIAAWDEAHVGVRLSPADVHYGMGGRDRPATYDYLIRALAERRLGYLHVVRPNKASFDAGPVQIDDVPAFARARFAGPIIVNGGFERAAAEAVLAKGDADLVAFGVPFLANPDLVRRLASDAPYNRPDPATFYGLGAEGYTDYPLLEEVARCPPCSCAWQQGLQRRHCERPKGEKPSRASCPCLWMALSAVPSRDDDGGAGGLCVNLQEGGRSGPPMHSPPSRGPKMGHFG